MAKLFLVRYPEPPAKIPEKGMTTIGRSEENTIVLAERRVSRRHAQIEWNEEWKKFLLTDLESANGTFLNNHKIRNQEKQPLQDWDKIRIASFVFTARFVNDPGIIKYEFKELRERVHSEVTEILDVGDIRKMVADLPVLSGNLEHLCPIELFQMLESGRKTGLLTLITDAGQSEFGIKEGNIITGTFNEFRGESAVFEILKFNKGQFAFILKPEMPAEQQIILPTTMLLMEGCRLLDEANAVTES